MMARYYTEDRLWRATDKITDNRELIQLDYHGATGWTWAGDYTAISQVTRWVNPARFNIPDDERRTRWQPSAASTGTPKP